MQKIKTTVMNIMKRYNLPINQKQPAVEIYSDSEVLVFSCNSVTEYTESTICFCGERGSIRISGENLSVCELNCYQSIINGKITAVELFD